VQNTLYNVTALYDGSDYEIYINGELDAFTSFSGLILTTPIELMIGQVLPGINQYNFKGTLDDIRIYNYALSYNTIQSLYDFVTDVDDEQENTTPDSYRLLQNYPNPFNGKTNIKYQVSEESKIKLEIFNILGQKIITLANEQKLPGYYSVIWDSKNDFGKTMNSGIYFVRLVSNNFSKIKKIVLLK